MTYIIFKIVCILFSTPTFKGQKEFNYTHSKFKNRLEQSCLSLFPLVFITRYAIFPASLMYEPPTLYLLHIIQSLLSHIELINFLYAFLIILSKHIRRQNLLTYLLTLLSC